ncbi:hypothetical protein B0H16DRAFT_1476551 [Mycena metata]|uniref:DUF6532 domain-containing protein n=1 Tax=Mycena metata TaxID=1033252 RepID=A0AAD7HB54_9AGAR|nr:hypothetical protein B0H16DRAFT_1476551 [Mycena metata]
MEMPIGSAEPATLTRAQKRKLTMEQAEEKARQEQKAFVAAASLSTELAGGCKAKLDAQENAVWNRDNPTSRKRTSLTDAEVSTKTKKPRQSVPTGEAEEDLEPVAQPRVKAALSKKKYAAPVIHNSDSEPEAVVPALLRLDFTNLPPPSAKFKAAGKGKAKQVPQVITAKKATVTALTSDSENESKMSDAKSADRLFDSDQESTEIEKPRYRCIDIISDSDNELPDAPPRRTEDPGLHEAIADALKPRKVSAARQKQADLEKPEIHAAPVPVKQEAREHTLGEDPVRSEGTWHVSARITYPAPGKKDILLNSQTEELQMVLRTSIAQVKVSLHFEASYPPIIARAGFARSYLISAAEKHPEATHILYRLHRDLNFATILADIILDRINILRGDIKRIAVALTPGLYQFAGLSEAKAKELIEMLLKDHHYIFPVDPKTKHLMTEKPFLHPALSAVIKQAVFNRSFKANNMHLFVSTSKAHPKRVELPDAMVALGATAVYASLVEYRATGERQNIPFTEGAYEDTYKNHMKTLADTRDYAPVVLHQVLHGLFNQLICFFSDGKSTQPEAGSSATLINLVEVEESD